MKVWKRCLAALLSFTILYSSTDVAQAAGTFYEKFLTWTASRAEILAEFYGLSEKETAVLMNEAIDQGYQYTLSYPYPNKEDSRKNLVEIDYLNRNVYAKAYASGGYTWKPVTAVISAGGEVQEEIALSEGTCYFAEKEYNASGAFTYSGNSYTATVTYELTVDIAIEEQNRILNIPSVLAQTAANAGDLNSMRFNVKKLGEMSPSLNELLTMEFEVEKTKLVDQEDEEGNVTQVKETVTEKEPALDSTEDAEVIAAISAIYKEYIENNGMVLYSLAEEYNKDPVSVLSFVFANGEKIRDKSTELFEHANTLKSSTRLKKVISKLNTENVELYQNIQYLSSVTTALIGTARKPGPLRELKDTEHWAILDENVKNSILKNGYSKEELAALEPSVYALRNTTINVAETASEIVKAATATVSCDITFYNVNVSMTGKVASGEVEDKSLIDMEPASTTLKLLEGTTAEELEEAIWKCGIENTTLSSWNALNGGYQINAGNYNREATTIKKDLNQDLEYKISYEPKYYSVKTNFAGSDKLPFGYVIALPSADDDSDISYEYVVETDEGAKLNLEEGATYKVTKDVSITQVEGNEKQEKRLYDYLIEDVQYGIGEDVQKIFKNSALDSPMVKIYTPDGSTVGEVVLKDGVYSITAEIVNAGSGMKWIPYVAKLLDDGAEVEEVLFDENGVAAWTNPEFSHVQVKYQLKIDKVKNGWLTEEYTNEDVFNALNLPKTLVEEVVAQNQLLSTGSGVTVKALYDQLSDVLLKTVMSQTILSSLGESMTTKTGKNAVRILQGSENEIVKDASGKKLGYGAWDFANDQLAIHTYMQYCSDAGWSLANYYKNGYYEDISKQAKIVGECLVNVSTDPGLIEYLTSMGLSDAESYRSNIEILGQKLQSLSRELNPPPEALNVNDPEFPSLIEYLISMEGKVSGVDKSNHIYAYTAVLRNGEKAGCITVSVQVGSMVTKTKDIGYVMEGSEHVLTEEDITKINAALSKLEAECGLTEDEGQYYEIILDTGIPNEGTSVGKYVSVVRKYAPKEYRVTCEGLEGYEATFLYKSDYVIELPPYSDDVNEINYYWYQIRDEEVEGPKKVYNGSKGVYKFEKEDLTTLFDKTGHLRISVSIHQNISEWDIQPNVKIAEAKKAGVILDYEYNHENKLLFIDGSAEGISKVDFNKYVTFFTEASGTAETSFENAHKNGSDHPLLANGTIIECTSPDKTGKSVTTEIMLIVLGDVNKDSLVNAEDLRILKENYLGTATEQEEMGALEARLAADVNGNGTEADSNDAFCIVKKYGQVEK